MGVKTEAGSARYTISYRKFQWENQKKVREKLYGRKNGGGLCPLYHIKP